MQVSEMIRTKTAVYTLIVGIRSRFFPVIHQSHGQSQAPEVCKTNNSTYSVCLHVFSNFGRNYCVRYACFWCIQKASCLMDHPTETCGNMCPLDSDFAAFPSKAKIQCLWTWTPPTFSIERLCQCVELAL